MNRRHDPVAADRVGRDALDGDHRSPVGGVLVDQLLGDRHAPRVDHHVVRQQDRERFVADQLLGHQHCVSQPQLLLLVDERDGADLRDAAHRTQQVDLAALLEPALERRMRVEMLLDRAPTAGDDDDDLLDPGCDCLLDRVLDDRAINRLGRGQEAGAEAGRRKDGLSDAHGDRVTPPAGCRGPCCLTVTGCSRPRRRGDASRGGEYSNGRAGRRLPRSSRRYNRRPDVQVIDSDHQGSQPRPPDGLHHAPVASLPAR